MYRWTSLKTAATRWVWRPNQLATQDRNIRTGIDLSFFDTLLHVCPADRRPSFIAVNSVFTYLAMTLAPLAGSALAERAGIRAVLVIAVAIHILAAVLFWVFRVATEEGEG
jgi:MFS family permease